VQVTAENPQATVALMAAPSIRIVSLTITEKGYCHDPATGRLQQAHPDIRHDLENPAAPCSAIGAIVAALARRRANGIAPFTVLCCDNLPHNGALVAACATSPRCAMTASPPGSKPTARSRRPWSTASCQLRPRPISPPPSG
jgi:mannitol-1-phosphate/altronate dehydrogenase